MSPCIHTTSEKIRVEKNLASITHGMLWPRELYERSEFCCVSCVSYNSTAGLSTKSVITLTYADRGRDALKSQRDDVFAALPQLSASSPEPKPRYVPV